MDCNHSDFNSSYNMSKKKKQSLSHFKLTAIIIVIKMVFVILKYIFMSASSILAKLLKVIKNEQK